MAQLVNFDKTGIIGPFATLITEYKTFTNEQIQELVQLIHTNFHKQTNTNLTYEAETILSDSNVFESNLVKYFLNLETNEETKLRIKKFLTPSTLEFFKIESNELTLELFAKIHQSYVSNEKSVELCDNREKNPYSEETRKLRMTIGLKITKDADNGNFLEADLNALLAGLNTITNLAKSDSDTWNKYNTELINFRDGKESDEIKSIVEGQEINHKVLPYVLDYVTLFATASNPLALAKEVTELLDTLFRKKHYYSVNIDG